MIASATVTATTCGAPSLATAHRRRGHRACALCNIVWRQRWTRWEQIVRALERAGQCELAIDQLRALRRGEEARSTNSAHTKQKGDPASSINGLDCENLGSQHVANVQHLAVRLRQRGWSVHIRNEGLLARRVENPDSRPHDNVVAGKAGDFSGIGGCHAKLPGIDK